MGDEQPLRWVSAWRETGISYLWWKSLVIERLATEKKIMAAEHTIRPNHTTARREEEGLRT